MSGENEIPLAEAIERARQQGLAEGNAYEWYRKQAARDGQVHIGEQPLRVVKRGPRWVVNERELTEAIASALAAQTVQLQAERQADDDYKARKLNPAGARTPWGGYRVQGEFHHVWSDYARMQKRSDGDWICNRCWKPASTEHGKPECHRCSNWNGCGTDCTLSRIYCVNCGTSVAA